MIKTGIIYETLGSVSNMQVVESKNPNEVRLSGVFGVCGVRNDNHRVYEKANYAKCLEALQTKIANNNCLGELEHPNSFNINLDNVSHIIEAIQMNEDGTVTGTVKLLNTPKGQIAKAIVEGGAPLFISSRAAGSVDSKGNVTLQSIATYDLVGTPGFSQAKLTAENKKFECLNESLENPCWMIVESETPEEGDDANEKEEPQNEPSAEKPVVNATKSDGQEKENNDNKDNTVTMEDLKKSIEELTQKVNQLEAQLHVAQESIQPVEYEMIESWIREEFAPELRSSINESIAEGVENWVVQEIAPKINNWITEEFASNIQSWIVEHFAGAVQDWITEEYSKNVQDWITEEYSAKVQDWITEEYSAKVQDWITEEYSAKVQDWIGEEYSNTLQQWITEHFADTIEKWINEEYSGTLQNWLNEEVMPQYKNEITESINTNLSEYLESKKINESSNKFANIDAVLEKLSEKAASLTRKEAKEVIKESSGSKYKGVFVVENMPMQYRPMFESLSEKQQDEIICRARMYDFTKPNALESFWANQDFNVTRIVESANEDINKEPVLNPAANNVITSMRRMLHIV